MPSHVHHMLRASSDPDIDVFTISQNFTIVTSYDKSVGKFPVAYGNVALIDCLYVFEYLFDYANNTYANQLSETEALIFREWLNYVKSNATAMNVTMCNYAFEIDGVLKNQVNYYMQSYPKIVETLRNPAELIYTKLSVEVNSTISMPLMTQFSKSQLLLNFLSSTLICVICFLGLLTSQLLYSLTISDVETKTYEYGMLRALGFKSSHLIAMITLQSFLYSVPGVIAGISVALTFNVIIRFMIFYMAGNAVEFGLTTTAICIGLCFGFFMPLISIYFPIKAALGKNLKDSLDLTRRQTNEKSVEMQRLEDMGLSVTQTTIAVLMVGMGFMTYYLVPLTYINEKMKWFLLCFDAILMMIILGLTFMSLLLFEHLEKFLLWLLIRTCARKDRKLHGVIVKNLDGHRSANMKSSIMFTMTISFLIYAASSFKLLSGMIRGSIVNQYGSDVYVKAGSFSTYPLDETELTDFLEIQ